MKPFLLLLILSVACHQAGVSKRESDREHDGFVGPVKRVFVVWSPISGSNYPVGSRCRQMTNEYDENGRLMRHSVYPGACGSDEIREDYSYSQDGNQTIKTQEIRGTNSPPPPPAVASRSNSEEDKGPAKKAITYDQSGRLSEVSVVKPRGRLSYKTIYTYDERGRVVEIAGYDGDSRITARRVYKFSGDDRVPSEFTYYGSDGRVYERTTYTDYEFNSKGDWVQRRQTKEETFNRHSVSMTFREIEYYPDSK
jgi:hypothetical protein